MFVLINLIPRPPYRGGLGRPTFEVNQDLGRRYWSVICSDRQEGEKSKHKPMPVVITICILCFRNTHHRILDHSKQH